MSLSIVYTRAQFGVDAPLVTVESHLSNGLPGFTIVGLPETAVKESKDRVRSALLNSHFDFPARRITVNLAPADLPKEGGRYDLAIALGILAASEQIPATALAGYEFIGELALSGELRPVKACVPAALACGQAERKLILPKANAEEAALCCSTKSYTAKNLLSVCAHLHSRESLTCVQRVAPDPLLQYDEDLYDVKGQAQAKRALEVAAAGGHNLLFYGPPGTGKSMLASRLPSILPPMEEAEAIAVAAVNSVSHSQHNSDWHRRPFRNPHHTASAIALVGGGSQPKPGEISLAHCGVLFLDELPEFPRHVLEVLREPLESGTICISRANAQVQFPANFQLIAAMNPCPCGYYGDQSDRCRCTPAQIQRYRAKISGPLLDRIDLHIPIHAIDPAKRRQLNGTENSAIVRQRVIVARKRQLARQGKTNAALSPKELERICQLHESEFAFLNHAISHLKLSARAYDRTLRVARTLADLAKDDDIKEPHLSEALSYRTLDRIP